MGFFVSLQGMTTETAPVSIASLREGQVFELDTITLSEEQIIEFAKTYDPLPFHIDKEAAAQSHFGELVASGPNLFFHIYRRDWIPRFGHSVLAGLEVNNWKFYGPTRANQPQQANISVKALKPNSERGHMVVTWLFDFRQTDGQQVQTLEMTVLHRMA